jgi:hypothetical protein
MGWKKFHLSFAISAIIEREMTRHAGREYYKVINMINSSVIILQVHKLVIINQYSCKYSRTTPQ